MYAVRRWSVRHARSLERFYAAFERLLVALHPLLNQLGYERLERPVASVENAVKGFLFGCHVMAYRQEQAVAEIIDRSVVLGGRVPWFPERDTGARRS